MPLHFALDSQFLFGYSQGKKKLKLPSALYWMKEVLTCSHLLMYTLGTFLPVIKYSFSSQMWLMHLVKMLPLLSGVTKVFG